jgi:hypothetical protein
MKTTYALSILNSYHRFLSSLKIVSVAVSRSFISFYLVQESLDRVLEEAVRMNDPFRVYTQMLQIYADSGKTEVCVKY